MKKGNVFTDDLIECYVNLKWRVIYAFEYQLHPVEYKMHYSA